MHLFDKLKSAFSRERYNAQQAQEMAHLYSWGPVIFQVCRLMIKYGILDMLAEQREGLTQEQIAERTGLSSYAVKCLLEASLTTHIVLIDPATDTYRLAKTGWFLLRDAMIRADIDFKLFYLTFGHAMLSLCKKMLCGELLPSDDFGNGRTELEMLAAMAVSYLRKENANEGEENRLE